MLKFQLLEKGKELGNTVICIKQCKNNIIMDRKAAKYAISLIFGKRGWV